MPDNNDAPAFNRTSAHGEVLAELRVNTPRWMLDVLDGMVAHETAQLPAGAQPISRTVLVNRILERECAKELHRSRMLLQTAGGNPTVQEQLGLKP